MLDTRKFISYDQLSQEELREKADHLDDPYAQFIYGWKLITGIYEPEHDMTQEGTEYVRRAVSKGCVDAEFFYATECLSMNATHQNDELKQECLQLLESAKLKGHFHAAISLGYIHFQKGEKYDPFKATQIWMSALHTEGQETQYPTPPFLSHLSSLFSLGAYGFEQQSNLAGQLHILSYAKSGSTNKQKDVLRVLSQMKSEKPELFERIEDAGVNWPNSKELEELIHDEPNDRVARNSLKEKRIKICSDFLAIQIHDDNIRNDVIDYIKGKLPLTITNVQNMKFDF